jgi:hypothetical protein
MLVFTIDKGTEGEGEESIRTHKAPHMYYFISNHIL